MLNEGKVSHPYSLQRELHHSQSLNFVSRSKRPESKAQREQRKIPPDNDISRSAALPLSNRPQSVPRKHYITQFRVRAATARSGGDKVITQETPKQDGSRSTMIEKLLPATTQQSTPWDDANRPSYVSTLSDTSLSSTTKSELRMSDMTKCTSISGQSRRPAMSIKEEESTEWTVDDAIDMYAAGFDEDSPSEEAIPPLIPLEDEEQRRSWQISEAINDSILIPPPSLLVSRPSMATTRNSLAIISNTARPSSASPTIPPLLSPTATRDQYGFLKSSHHVSVSQYEAWHGPYSSIQGRRANKWHAFMRSHDLPTYNPTTFPRRSPKTQRFIRKGIPAEWRGAAWYYYSGAHEYKAGHPNLYQSLITRSSTSDLSDTDNGLIERDLHRTFPDNVRFKDPSLSISPPTTSNNETPLLLSLRRVLCAFAIHCPKIGYCQSLNFIAGLLLLFLPEEQAFWMLHLITREYLPGTHDVSLEGANTDLRILMTLLKEHTPHIWSQIESRNPNPNHPTDTTTTAPSRLPPVSLCCTSWFMALFIGTLPIESTLRIWDILFYEGPHTIFRVAVAIFRLCGPDLKNLPPPSSSSKSSSSRSGTDTGTGTDSGEIFQLVQNAPRRMLDVGVLLRVALDSKGAVGGEVIERMRREGARGRSGGVVAVGRSLTEKGKVKRGGSLWRKKLG